jgi:hypothetical protein
VEAFFWIGLLTSICLALNGWYFYFCNTFCRSQRPVIHSLKRILTLLYALAQFAVETRALFQTKRRYILFKIESHEGIFDIRLNPHTSVFFYCGHFYALRVKPYYLSPTAGSDSCMCKHKKGGQTRRRRIVEGPEPFAFLSNFHLTFKSEYI